MGPERELELMSRLDAERSAHEDTRRERDEARALGEQCVAYEGEGIPWSRPLDDYAQWVTGAVLNERIRRASVDLAAAQARIAELEAALRRITQAHQDAAYDHEAQRAAVFNFVGNVAENALSASSPKDALLAVCEKVAVSAYTDSLDHPEFSDLNIPDRARSIVSYVFGTEVKP